MSHEYYITILKASGSTAFHELNHMSCEPMSSKSPRRFYLQPYKRLAGKTQFEEWGMPSPSCFTRFCC